VAFGYQRAAPWHRRPACGLLGAIVLGLALLVRHSHAPLRLVTWLGCLASLLNAAYAVYVVGVHFVKHRVMEGWTTLSLHSSLMFFFTFLTLSLLTEAMGRVLETTSGRPLYHVLEEVGGSLAGTANLRNVVADLRSPGEEGRDAA
jgi:hypothetical protein